MNPSKNSDDVEAVAASWFARRQREDWSAEDQAELDSWLAAATAHRVSFIRLSAAWERAGRLTAIGAGIAPGTIPPRDGWRFSSLPPISAQLPMEKPGFMKPLQDRRMAIAAAGILTISIAGAGWYWAQTRADTFTTRVGAIRTISLGDGSKVTLDTDSEMQVDLERKERHVQLERGQAYFVVAKDPTRPFVVDIANKRIIAVGTEFVVRRNDEDIRVFVAEGRIAVEHDDVGMKTASIQVAAGSEAITAKTAVLVDEPPPAEVEQLTNWRTGFLSFHDTALATAVAEFNRYSDRQIQIADPSISDLRIGGSFRANNAGTFLALLQSGFPVHVEEQGNRILLTRR